jgi:hypothetical protein
MEASFVWGAQAATPMLKAITVQAAREMRRAMANPLLIVDIRL